MDANIERWKTAQTAETNHRSHKDHQKGHARAFTQFGITPDDIAHKDILAVGAGTGVIHGIDIECNNVAVDPLTSDFKDALENSTAKLVTAAGEYLPFRDDSFDIVLNRNVLDHTVNPERVLAEIRRVLKPGGHFIFDVNAFKMPRQVRKRLSYIDTPHPHHFSPSEVESLLIAQGFDIKQKRVEKMSLNLQNTTIKRIAGVAIFRIRKIQIMAQ